MIQRTAFAHSPLDLAQEAGRAALCWRGSGAPIVARPGAQPNTTVGAWALDQEQLLRSAGAAAHENVERVAHRAKRRSATIAPNSNARYNNENLYNDQAAGIHWRWRATFTTPRISAISSKAVAPR